MTKNRKHLSNQQIARYFNRKHPKKDVIYMGRKLPLKKKRKKTKIDVKTFVTPNDLIVKKFLKSQKINIDLPNDKKVHQIQKAVVKYMKYIPDKNLTGVDECWLFPFETIHMKSGDCEDGAILMASMMINAKVPSFRVRVAAGYVQSAPTAPQGGHGYCCYLRESDNQWVVIDWCYFEDSKIPVEKKPIINKNKKYKKVWFSFNNKFSWANKRFEFNNRKDLEK